MALTQQAIRSTPRSPSGRTISWLTGLLLIVFSSILPGGWTFPTTLPDSAGGANAWLDSAALHPIRVNGRDGILLWLHDDPTFSRKLLPVVDIPDLPAYSLKSGFVAIQGHGEDFHGEHYLLVEGVHQWVRTSEFVAAVRTWLGYDAQILLLACNPDGDEVNIPNTIYWKDNLVDVTYGVGPWVMGKWIEDDPGNGRQGPIYADREMKHLATANAMRDAITKLHQAIGAENLRVFGPSGK